MIHDSSICLSSTGGVLTASARYSPSKDKRNDLDELLETQVSQMARAKGWFGAELSPVPPVAHDSSPDNTTDSDMVVTHPSVNPIPMT